MTGVAKRGFDILGTSFSSGGGGPRAFSRAASLMGEDHWNFIPMKQVSRSVALRLGESSDGVNAE